MVVHQIDKSGKWIGDRVGVAQEISVEAGSVILHVDDSGEHGVEVATLAGEIEWQETCRTDWRGSLAAETRRLLAMDPAYRAQPTSDDSTAEIQIPTPTLAGCREELRAALLAEGWTEDAGKLIAPEAASYLSVNVARILADLEALS